MTLARCPDIQAQGSPCPGRSVVSIPPLGLCDSDVKISVSRRGGGEKGGAAAAAAAASHYIAGILGAVCPLFPLSFVECLPLSDSGRGDMAGYLKVLSSLSRSAAAAFSRNPAVLAPAANCQTLQQRNCEWREISGVILSIMMFDG